MAKQAKRHLGELLEVSECYDRYGSKFSLMLLTASKRDISSRLSSNEVRV